MENYKNLSRQSNVSQYQIGSDYIIVKFKNRGKSGSDTYKYTYSSAGQNNVVHMKELAVIGLGLNTFINSEVRKKYESKW